MTELVPPPPDANNLPEISDGDVKRVSALLGRIYRTQGPFPSRWDEFRSFGPTNGRFDPHPLPQGFHETCTVFYASIHVTGGSETSPPLLETCVAEAFQDGRVIELSRGNPWFTVIQVTRPVELLDLDGSSWITRAGGNAAISSGSRQRSREWAQAIHRRFGNRIDGLLYPSAVLPMSLNVALWSGAASAFPAHPMLNRPLNDPAFRADLEQHAIDIGYDLVLQSSD
ncbi:MAG TPA: RES family NAD+ phosphorylase [Actinomycetota bacterium]|nr:RES family NAD+ phosphorylase [Actinomycetota bacterium]